MVIYYFKDTFPLFRFRDYENHDLNRPKEYIKSSLLNIIDSELVVDGTIEKKKMALKSVLLRVAEKEGLHLLETLLTIYPTMIFVDDKVDAWEILKDSFSSEIGETDKTLLRHALNFKLDTSFLTNELKRINNIAGFKAKYSKIFKQLYIAYYKYCFVLFVKSIDFKLSVKKREKVVYESNFVFDFRRLKRELLKNERLLENPKMSEKLPFAILYKENFIASCRVDTLEESKEFLDEILSYNTPKGAEKRIYFSIADNINFPRVAVNSKKKFNMELRELFNEVNKPLFHFKDSIELDKERLRDIQKHLSYKK